MFCQERGSRFSSMQDCMGRCCGGDIWANDQYTVRYRWDISHLAGKEDLWEISALKGTNLREKKPNRPKHSRTVTRPISKYSACFCYTHCTRISCNRDQISKLGKKSNQQSCFNLSKSRDYLALAKQSQMWLQEWEGKEDGVTAQDATEPKGRGDMECKDFCSPASRLQTKLLYLCVLYCYICDSLQIWCLQQHIFKETESLHL